MHLDQEAPHRSELHRSVRQRQLQRLVPEHGGSNDKPAGLSALSRRELQIAELVSFGSTNRQIARELRLSERTVETYLSRAFTKLSVSSRAAVASIVVRWQLEVAGAEHHPAR
ncbi:MAG: response regulator transcription factor [Egibacteraceae bacterium]